MERRGAVFGPREAEGVTLQAQVGTEPTGYAIAYGFHGDTLFFGSSPDVIGQAVSARREGDGLVTTDTFQAVLAALPEDPSLVIYLNSEPLISMAQANMTEEQYQNSQEYVLMEAFEAIGLGLRFQPGSLDGVAYFFASD